MTPKYPVVGVMESYTPMAEPFRMFWTATMHGLAFVHEKELRILALAAHHEGRGDCGRFLVDVKNAYDLVGIYRIENRVLEEMLMRRGFAPTVEMVAGEEMPGMVWIR